MFSYLAVGVCLQIFFLSVVVGEVVYVVDRMRWWDRVVPYTDAEDWVEILAEVGAVVGAVSFYASYVIRWVVLASEERRFLHKRLVGVQRAFITWVIIRWSHFLYTLYLDDPFIILVAYWQETFVVAGWVLYRYSRRELDAILGNALLPKNYGWDCWSWM